MNGKLIFLILLVIVTAVYGNQSNIRAQATQTNHSSGTLALGSSFTGIDGVTVDASGVPGHAESNILIERLKEDELGVSPPRVYTPITPYYRISATPELFTKLETPFLIRIPLPEDADVESIRPVTLHPSKYVTDVPKDISGVWLPGRVKYLPETHEAQLKFGILPSEGYIIVISGDVR